MFDEFYVFRANCILPKHCDFKGFFFFLRKKCISVWNSMDHLMRCLILIYAASKRQTSVALSNLTLNPFPNDKFQNLKDFADDNFKFDENGRKIFKWVANTVGKGEIARYEQFLLFPQCFQRLLLQTLKNQGLFGKGLTETQSFHRF